MMETAKQDTGTAETTEPCEVIYMVYEPSKLTGKGKEYLVYDGEIVLKYLDGKAVERDHKRVVA